jgi:tripartite-type tricarboxylate transporter receptor subunit TctC
MTRFGRSIGLAAVLWLPCVVGAQGYPVKPVRLVVPFAPGGTTDILARVLGQKLGESLGQQVLSDNRPGASGNLGSALVAKAAPDGYTLLLGVISPLAINVSIFGAKMPFDPVKDFAPISMITQVPQVIAMHPSVPAKTVREVIALAKKNPGKLNFGTAGAGTSNHLVGELFQTAGGFRMQHVPFKGAAPASIGVLSGEVDMMISAPPAVMGHFRSGRLRALAVSSAKRSPALPEVPTIAESGFPGFDATAWYCLVAPAGTPAPIVERVRAALVQAIDSPQVRERLLAEGAEPESSTPEQLGAFIRAEIPKWERAVKLSGARLD